MIEIRLTKDYDKSQLKFILERIKKVAPRELTYSLVETGGADVCIREKGYIIYASDYETISKNFRYDLWIVIFKAGYVAYYQGE
ncbi:hypothetical protein NL351_27590, partial [Klebsiella pneumoniae]|nr:hypothetical protein [Klebsiella pneumoniae]